MSEKSYTIGHLHVETRDGRTITNIVVDPDPVPFLAIGGALLGVVSCGHDAEVVWADIDEALVPEGQRPTLSLRGVKAIYVGDDHILMSGKLAGVHLQPIETWPW